MKNKSIVRSGVNVTKGLEVIKIATTIDISATGKYEDASQQAWDALITLIGMRSQPVLLTTPVSVNLSNEDDVSLTGQGYIFEFASEHVGTFATHDHNYEVIDPVGILRLMLDDIVLNGVAVEIGSNTEIITTTRY